MLGIAVGTVCLFGLARVARGGRYGHHGRRCRDGGRRDAGWAMARRLELTDEQEEAMREQIRQWRKRLRAMRGELVTTRENLADAVRADDFDANALGEMFARHDDAIRLLRLELVERLAHVHGILEPAQRAVLADAIERGAVPNPGQW